MICISFVVSELLTTVFHVERPLKLILKPHLYTCICEFVPTLATTSHNYLNPCKLLYFIDFSCFPHKLYIIILNLDALKTVFSVLCVDSWYLSYFLGQFIKIINEINNALPLYFLCYLNMSKMKKIFLSCYKNIS